MAWGAVVAAYKSDDAKVVVHFFEDATGEVYDIDAPVPLDATDKWLEDYVAHRIVALSARTSAIAKVRLGYVTPTAEIVGTTPVAADPAPKPAEPKV